MPYVVFVVTNDISVQILKKFGNYLEFEFLSKAIILNFIEVRGFINNKKINNNKFLSVFTYP